MATRQVQRAIKRIEAKIEKAAERVKARRAIRAAKKMPALSRDQARGYPQAAYQPFEPAGQNWRGWPDLGKREAARRLARMARAGR